MSENSIKINLSEKIVEGVDDDYFKNLVGLVLDEDIIHKERLLLTKGTKISEQAVKLIINSKIELILIEPNDDIYYKSKVALLQCSSIDESSDIPSPEHMISVKDALKVTKTLPEDTQVKIQEAIENVTVSIFNIDLDKQNLAKRSTDQILSPVIGKEIPLDLPQKDFVGMVKSIIINIAKYDKFYALATFDELSEKKYSHIALHNVEVMMFMLKTGKMLSLPEKYTIDLSISALIWNIGRIAIDNDLFFKNGVLSKTEKEKLLIQNEASYRILSDNENKLNFYSLVAAGRVPEDISTLEYDKLDEMSKEERAYFYYQLIKAADAYCGIRRESIYHSKRDIIRTMIIMKDEVRLGRIPFGGYSCFWQAHDLFQKNTLFPISFDWIEEIGISKESLSEFVKATLFGIVLKVMGTTIRFAILKGKDDSKGNIIKNSLRLVSNKKYDMNLLDGLDI